MVHSLFLWSSILLLGIHSSTAASQSLNKTAELVPTPTTNCPTGCSIWLGTTTLSLAKDEESTFLFKSARKITVLQVTPYESLGTTSYSWTISNSTTAAPTIPTFDVKNKVSTLPNPKFTFQGYTLRWPTTYLAITTAAAVLHAEKNPCACTASTLASVPSPVDIGNAVATKQFLQAARDEITKGMDTATCETDFPSEPSCSGLLVRRAFPRGLSLDGLSYVNTSWYSNPSSNSKNSTHKASSLSSGSHQIYWNQTSSTNGTRSEGGVVIAPPPSNLGNGGSPAGGGGAPPPANTFTLSYTSVQVLTISTHGNLAALPTLAGYAQPETNRDTGTVEGVVEEPQGGSPDKPQPGFMGIAPSFVPAEEVKQPEQPSPIRLPAGEVAVGGTVPAAILPNGGGIEYGTVTVPPGAQSTIDGVVVSVAADAETAAIGTTTFGIDDAPSRSDNPPPPEVGGQPIVSAANGGVVIGDQVVNPGNAIKIADATVSVAQDGMLFINGQPAAGQPTPAGQPAPAVLGGLAVTPLGNDEIVVAGLTLAPGVSTTLGSGETISVGNGGVVIVNSQTVNIPKPTAAVVGGQAVTLLPNGGVVVSGQTIAAGQITTLENGNIVSVGTGGLVVVNGQSTTISPASITVGGQTILPGQNGAVVIAGQTLTPGSMVTVANGQVVSVGQGGAVVVNGQTITVGPSPATPTGSSVIVVNGQTLTVPASNYANKAPITVNGVVFTPLPGGAVIVSGTAILPGVAVTLSNGQVVSIPRASATTTSGTGSQKSSGTASQTATSTTSESTSSSSSASRVGATSATKSGAASGISAQLGTKEETTIMLCLILSGLGFGLFGVFG